MWDGRISSLLPCSRQLPIQPLPLESPPSLQPVFYLAHFTPLREGNLLAPLYALLVLAISSLPPSMRAATSENTIFIGIMRPLKANMGTVTSVPAK